MMLSQLGHHVQWTLLDVETNILDPEYVAALTKKAVASSGKSGKMQARNELVKIIPDAKLVPRGDIGYDFLMIDAIEKVIK